MRAKLFTVLREVVTIVFSVVVALQFQDCAAQQREKRLAREARGAIRRELLRNWTDVNEVVHSNVEEIERVRSILAAAHGVLKGISVKSATLNDAAWTSAVATHAINAMRYEEAEAYASAYKNQRDLEHLVEQATSGFISSVLSLDEGKDFLRRYERTLHLVIDSQRQLIAVYDEALR